MKLAVALFCLLFSPPALFAAELTPAAPATGARSPVKSSAKGLFALELALPGGTLQTGNNAFDLLLRDKGGKGVEGARITVTPWLPEKNHGVWEKPTVTERGGGRYRVDNVAIALAGRWDLQVKVKKEAQEDQALFSFTVRGKQAAAPVKNEKPKGNYKRSVHRYNVPNVTLLNQEGHKVNIRSLVDSGKPVIVDFIYTTCNTICPVLSASFANLRRELGADADKVQFISISIDPEHDRPEQMKKYLSRFSTGPGWDFLTGSNEDIRQVLRSLDATIEDKMAHEPIYLLRAPQSEEWVRIKGLLRKSDLLSELRGIANR